MAATTKAPAAPAAKTATKKAADTAAPAVPTTFGLNIDGKKKPTARIEMVPYKNIHIEPGFNPRKKFGDLSGLEATLKVQGLIHPLNVRPFKAGDKPGHFRIIAGERRYRAIGGLGWDTVPVIVRDDLTDDDLRAKALAGAENGDEARQPLTHREKGEMFKSFADQGWNIKKIAKETGAGERDVRRCLDLVKAPEDVQKAFDGGKLNFSTALQVAALDDDTRKAAIKRFASEDSDEQASQVAVKQFAKEYNKGENTDPKKASNKKKGKSRAASLKAWKGNKAKEKQLAELCYNLLNTDPSEKGTTTWHELRGGIGWCLWERGDVAYPVMVPVDPKQAPDAKEAKKELKRIDDIIEAFAAKHTPDPEDAATDDAAGEAGDNGDAGDGEDAGDEAAAEAAAAE